LAKISTIGSTDIYIQRLNALAGDKGGNAAKAAVYAGVNVLADAMREGYGHVLSSNSTGQMLAAMGVTPIQLDQRGWWNAKIGFDGYDTRKARNFSRGVPHQLKARVIESGTKNKHIKGHQVIKRAVKANRAAVEKAMEQALDLEIRKIMEG